MLSVGPGEEGRVDRFVAERLGLSRTRVQALLAEGRVLVDGHAARKSERVESGSRVQVEIPPAEAVEMLPEDIPISIAFEDEHLLVVDKAAGMVVHPAPGHRTGTLVNALLFHVRDLPGVGGRLRPGIVHRLDRDTSGLLVVAKTDLAQVALADALRRRRVKRLYRAACWGHLEEPSLTVDAPIGRDPKDRKRMAVVEGGRRAVTRVRVRERWLRADLLDVALQTGRTHQIRVHLAHIGHPVVGDRVYGARWVRGMGGAERGWARELDQRTPRHFLHAAELMFEHPATGRRMRFHSGLPEDLAAAAAWAAGE
ncbi:MAG: RluA family pseudouridine synthase [Gemmatimonadetes bacterium]|nr:RluA family pseudouridine synthase [Gemmatimonadota bacterium]